MNDYVSLELAQKQAKRIEEVEALCNKQQALILKLEAEFKVKAAEIKLRKEENEVTSNLYNLELLRVVGLQAEIKQLQGVNCPICGKLTTVVFEGRCESCHDTCLGS